MARIPRSKSTSIQLRPAVSGFASGGGASPEAFGGAEARAEEARAGATERVGQAAAASTARIGAAEAASAARVAKAQADTITRIGNARAGTVTRAGAARASATARVGAAEAGAAGRTEAATTRALEGQESDADLLGAAGKLASDIGDNMVAASARITVRRESVERIGVFNDATTQMKESFAQERDQGANFANEESIAGFNQNIDAIVAQAAGTVAGHTPESQLLMLEDLSKLSAQYKDLGVSAGVKELEAQETRQFGEFVGEQAAKARNTPELIDTYRTEIDVRLAQMSVTSTPEEIETQRTAAYSAIAQGAFDNRMAFGLHSQARQILDSQSKFIPEDVAQTMGNRLTVAETTAEREQAVIANKTARVKASIEAAGGKMTPAITLAIEGITVPTRAPLTVTERVNELKELGVEVTDDMIAKMADALPDQAGLFGNSRVGRAHAVANDLVQAFSEGRTDQVEDQNFLSSVAIIAQVDPLTQKPGILPPHIQEALRERGFRASDLGDPFVTSPSVLAPTVLEDDGLGAPAVAAAGADESIEVGPIDEADPLREVVPEQLSVMIGGQTLAELTAQDFTGPGPALQALVGRVPGLGDGAGVVDSIRASVSLARERLVSALQQNPRFAVTEREQLKENVGLEPRFIDTPGAMLGSIVGTDQYLASLESELVNHLNGQQSAEKRKADTDSLALIRSFRERLAPPIISSTDDVEIQKQITEFLNDKTIVPGTPVIFMQNGKWRMARKPEPEGTEGEGQ